jgi:hypothetical protein
MATHWNVQTRGLALFFFFFLKTIGINAGRRTNFDDFNRNEYYLQDSEQQQSTATNPNPTKK